MLSLLGLSPRHEEEEELTPEQQDAADAFREKFYLYLSFGATSVIILSAGISYAARAVGLIA